MWEPPSAEAMRCGKDRRIVWCTRRLMRAFDETARPWVNRRRARTAAGRSESFLVGQCTARQRYENSREMCEGSEAKTEKDNPDVSVRTYE
jgi:hypothetical protein